MQYVRDINILKRIGCTDPGMYAVFDNTCEQEDSVCIDNDSIIENDEFDMIDNSQCDADFDVISDGNYGGIRNYMHGDICVYRKNSYGISCLEGIYDRTGMYRMQSRRGCTYYPGKEGRGVGIAIPQCKMMNSTVIDWMAVHKVYRGVSLYSRNSGRLKSLGDSGLCNDYDADSDWLRNVGFEVEGTHIPFDIWCIVGAVYGKALKIWRGVEKRDWNSMPSYMMVTVQEIFESLNPHCKWSDLCENSRHEWRMNLRKAFRWLNENGLAYDLPDENGKRHGYFMERIMENTWVEARADGDDEEKRCLSEWGNIWEVYGFKVKIRNSPLFQFCWRKRLNSPSVVQLRPYDYDSRMIMNGQKGWRLCFHSVWLAWLIQYRNYWKKRGGGFKSCELVWSQREMMRAFSGSIFDIRPLSSDEMAIMLEWHTPDGLKKKGGRPAHIWSYSRIRRCVFSWELPPSLSGEAVLVKDEQGINSSIADSGAEMTDAVKLARDRMECINQENSRHMATLDGRRIPVSESVIYRLGKDGSGRTVIEDSIHGRCYSRTGGIQGLHKEERARLKIDGHAVREVDYSALHPTMMYSLRGEKFTGRSMYDVGSSWHGGILSTGEARMAVKMMLLRMVNARSKWMAMYSFKSWWNLKHGRDVKDYIPWLRPLYDAIAKKHKKIADDFCTGKGPVLMNMDGRLVREVCWRLTQDGICALAVHDSVVVDARYESKAKTVMQEEYAKMFNGDYIAVK